MKVQKNRPSTPKKARGMRDFFPEACEALRQLEGQALDVARRYGYREVALPFIEPLELFERAVGLATDVVGKEMFHLRPESAGGLPLVLRPEATASCVRAGIEGGLLRHQVQRWTYCGPMFRRERPQLGRYRQFSQWGCEWLGVAAVEADVELMLTGQALLQALGLESEVRLEIHTLGEVVERQAYLEALKGYLQIRLPNPGSELRHRIELNPLRVLDTKAPELQALLEEAPKLMAYLGRSSLARFEACCQGLSDHGCQYSVAHRLVRGLDYYHDTVFEWVTERLGAQNALGGGGRYNGLSAALGGPDTPALGFALGLDRLLLLQASLNLPPSTATFTFVLGGVEGPKGDAQLLIWAEWLRRRLPEVAWLTFPGLTPEAQWRQAVRAGVVGWMQPLGEEGPRPEGEVRLKWLSGSGSQLLTLEAGLAQIRERNRGNVACNGIH